MAGCSQFANQQSGAVEIGEDWVSLMGYRGDQIK
jgi:hypothetical protein